MSMLLTLAAAAVLACQPAQVIDGDTIRCEGRSVRLVAINAREKNETCRKNAPCPRASGAAATAQLKRLVGQHHVICQEAGRPSRGRMVARCYARSQDLSCAMVRSGHAAEWRKFGRAC